MSNKKVKHRKIEERRKWQDVTRNQQKPTPLSSRDTRDDEINRDSEGERTAPLSNEGRTN